MSSLSEEDARTRHIRRADMVANTMAFIDCKMPGSERKENYALIGPGVSQSHDQVVNLTEAHGFSLGVAAMPPGTINNLHLHFTAEVFIIQRGTWTFRWGAEGRDGEVVGHPGDIVSIPTWIFRGFSNSGAEDGWIFTALGGDDTGGIIWHPSIIESASHHGLYLGRDNMMVDVGSAGPKPDAGGLMPMLTSAEIATLPRYTTEQMAGRVVRADARAWSGAALLDSGLPGHAAELAPAIGHGMSEDRAHAAPINNPHGFSIEWLRIQPGNRIGRHRLAEKQAAIVFNGALDVTLNAPGEEVTRHVATGELLSLPVDAWRSLAAAGEAAVEVALITASDARKRITWAVEIVQAATEMGVGLDHDGHVAPLGLLPPPTREAVIARMQGLAA